MNRKCALPIIICFLFVLRSLDAFSQQWQRLDSIAVTRRIGASSCVLGNKGYVGFGHDFNSRFPFNDLWEYDPGTRRWKNLDYFDGQFRTHAFMFGSGDELFFGGGTKDSGKTALRSLSKLNLKSNHLQSLKDLPFDRAVGASSVKLNDSVIYLIGGCTTDLCDSNIYRYNVKSDEWTVIAKNIRPGRFGFAFVLDSCIYLGLQSHDEINVFAETYKLNLRNLEWSFAKSFKGKPRTRVVYGRIDEHRAFVGLGAKLKVSTIYPHYITGMKAGSQRKLSANFFRDFYVFDDRNNKWKELPMMDKARRSAAAFFLDGYLYVGMGNEENLGLRDFNRLKIDDKKK